MPVFCFHSVRNVLAIPEAGMWPSEYRWREFTEFLTVDADWYADWVTRAQDYWGDDLVVTFDDAFQDVIVPAIMTAKMGIRTIVFIPTAHTGKLFPYAPYPVVSDVEAKFMSNMGVELGCHGHNHWKWTHKNRDVVEIELRVSLSILQYVTKRDTIALAPPHALFTSEHVRTAKELGVKEIFGTWLPPAGEIEGVHVRYMADIEGYVVGENHGEKWPWAE